MNNIYQINSLKLEYTKFYPVIRSKYLCISSSELTKSLTFTVFNILCTQYSSRLSTNNMMMIMMIWDMPRKTRSILYDASPIFSLEYHYKMAMRNITLSIKFQCNLLFQYCKMYKLRYSNYLFEAYVIYLMRFRKR